MHFKKENQTLSEKGLKRKKVVGVRTSPNLQTVIECFSWRGNYYR
jgi:hypothetical protein